MNNRRKFLINGTVFTTALLATKPFSALANVVSPFQEMYAQNNLVLLHTANFTSHNQHTAIQHIAATKKKSANSIVLNAGKKADTTATGLSFDASVTEPELSLLNSEYSIINKGGIKTGIIAVTAGENDIVNKVNNLSAYLKKEKNCQVVVCLSQLGFKNKNGMDDMKLAEKSTSLDVIIGGHTTNFSARPFIAANSKKAEVIIHSAASNKNAVGEMKIGFDEAGQKKSISFIDPFQIITKQQAKLTA